MLNNDRHASWLTDILAGVQANRPYIEHRADQIREQYADQDRRQRERRRQRAAQQGGGGGAA